MQYPLKWIAYYFIRALIHSELGISIVNGHVKKFITPIFLTWGISVYGIIEISDPEQSIMLIMKPGVKSYHVY